jgi:hypothetical protein
MDMIIMIHILGTVIPGEHVATAVAHAAAVPDTTPDTGDRFSRGDYLPCWICYVAGICM